MDYYIDTDNSFNRLSEEYTKYGSLTIAFDFDDTVYDFHKKGRTYDDVIVLLRQLKELNCFLICWTGQTDIEFVKDYLVSNNIPFDTINENPPFYNTNSRKIYANAFLDDRAGLSEVYNQLNKLITQIKQNKHV